MKTFRMICDLENSYAQDTKNKIKEQVNQGYLYIFDAKKIEVFPPHPPTQSI